LHVFICLREDVHRILLTKTQHSDKMRDVERLKWSKEALMAVLEDRIKFNYINVGENLPTDIIPSVFPVSIGTTNIENWLFERTLNRPRELLQLVRQYTENCDSEVPDAEMFKTAEINYSNWKLDDLCTEFGNQYPGLVTIFSHLKTNFYRTKYHLKGNEIDDLVLSILTNCDINFEWFNSLVENTDRNSLLNVLYEIGFIGDYIHGGQGGSKTFYSFSDVHTPSFDEIQIHPCFRKAIGTVERIRTKHN